jgi:hypothetical protein
MNYKCADREKELDLSRSVVVSLKPERTGSKRLQGTRYPCKNIRTRKNENSTRRTDNHSKRIHKKRTNCLFLFLSNFRSTIRAVQIFNIAFHRIQRKERIRDNKQIHWLCFPEQETPLIILRCWTGL